MEAEDTVSTAGWEVSVLTEAKVALAIDFACPSLPPSLSFWEQNLAPSLGNNLSGVPCGFGETTDQRTHLPGQGMEI